MTTATQSNVHSVLPSTHNSAETAFIAFWWPWGSNRTIKRFWVETATKGAKKGQQRTMDQSANKPWLYEYTSRAEKDGLAAANSWALEEIAANRVPWCKANASTYNDLRVIAEVPDPNDANGLHVEHLAADYYSPDWWYNFVDSVGDKLDETQRLRMESIGRVCRKMNGNSWTETETKRTTEGKPLYELPPPPPKA